MDLDPRERRTQGATGAAMIVGAILGLAAWGDAPDWAAFALWFLLLGGITIIVWTIRRKKA